MRTAIALSLLLAGTQATSADASLGCTIHSAKVVTGDSRKSATNVGRKLFIAHFAKDRLRITTDEAASLEFTCEGDDRHVTCVRPNDLISYDPTTGAMVRTQQGDPSSKLFMICKR
jgi:hypothetical protein